jgi:hypothetical protein
MDGSEAMGSDADEIEIFDHLILLTTGRFVARKLSHRAVTSPHFPFITRLDRGDSQAFPGFDIFVEGGLRDARRRDDLVDADGGEPLAVEELDSRRNQSAAPCLGRSRSTEELRDRFRARVLHVEFAAAQFISRVPRGVLRVHCARSVGLVHSPQPVRIACALQRSRPKTNVQTGRSPCTT